MLDSQGLWLYLGVVGVGEELSVGLRQFLPFCIARVAIVMEIPLEEMERDKLLNAKRIFQVTHARTISVKCALSSRRLVTPCIGLNCRHADHFELDVLLRRCIESWRCPVCKVKLPYYEIYIDQVLMEALEATAGMADLSAIKLRSTYEWEPVNSFEAQKSVMLNMVLGKRIKLENRLDQADSFYGVVRTSVQAEVVKKKFLFRKVQLNTAVALKAIPHLTPSTAYWMPFGSSSVLKFDIGDNTWKPVKDLPSIGNVSAYYSVLYFDSFIVTLGGIGLDGKSSKQCFVFSEELGLKLLPDMLVARHSFSAASFKKQIFVFGGLRKGRYIRHCETYNFKRDNWVQIADLLSPRACGVASGSEDTVYLMGGCEEDILIKYIDKYYISTTEWVRLHVQLRYGFQNAIAFRPGSLATMVVFGGSDLRKPLDSVFSFNTDDETLNYEMPQLPEACGDHTTFPVLWDSASQSAHFFNAPAKSRQLEHFFYDLSFLVAWSK
jgi:hypothetical protein